MSGIGLDVNIQTEKAAKEIADLLNEIVRGSKDAYRELARVLGQDIESRYFLDVKVDDKGVETLVPKLVEGNRELDKLVRATRKGISVKSGSLTSLRQTVNQAKKARDALAAIETVRINGKDVIRYTEAWLRANNTLRIAQAQLKSTELATQGIGGRLATAFNLGPIRGFARGLQDVVGAFQSVAIITGQVTGAINALTKTASKLQQFELAFKAIGQGSAGAVQALEDAKRISLGLGTDLDQVTTTFQQLTPVVTATGGSIEDVSAIVEALSSRFAAFGITGDRARRVTNGIVQAFAKGKLQAEELTQQISEADAAFKTDFAAALKAAGFASKGTTAELEKLVKAGRITVDVLAKTLPLIGKSDLLFGKLGDSAKSAADALKSGSVTIGQVENQFRNLDTLSLRNLSESAEPLRNELFELRAIFIDFVSNLSESGAFDGLFRGLARIVSVLGDLASAVAPIAGAFARLISIISDLVAGLSRVPGATQFVVVLIGAKLVDAATKATKAVTGLNVALNNFRTGGSAAQLARDILNLNRVADATSKTEVGDAIAKSATVASAKVIDLNRELRIVGKQLAETNFAGKEPLRDNLLKQQDKLNRLKARQVSLEALASTGIRGQVRDLKGVTSAQRLRTIQTIGFAKALQRVGIGASAAASISTTAFSRFAPVILGVKGIVAGLTKGFLALASVVGFKVVLVLLAVGAAIKLVSDSFSRLTSVNKSVEASSKQTEAAVKDLSEAVKAANERLTTLRAARSGGDGSLSDLIGSDDFNIVDEWVAFFLNGIDQIEEEVKGLESRLERVIEVLKKLGIEIPNPFAFEGDLDSLADEAVRLKGELDKTGISAEQLRSEIAILNSNSGNFLPAGNLAVSKEVAEFAAAVNDAERALNTAAPKIRANVDSITNSAKASFKELKGIGPLFDVFFEDDGSNATQIQQSLGGIAKSINTNRAEAAKWKKELTELRDKLKEAGVNTQNLEIPLKELTETEKRLDLAGEAVRAFGRTIGKEFDVEKGTFIDSLEDIQKELKETQEGFSGLNIGEDAFNQASAELFALEAQLERFRASQQDPLIRKAGADSSLAQLGKELSQAESRVLELNIAIAKGVDVEINERELNKQLSNIRENIRKQLSAAFASVNAELEIAIDNSEITELEAIGTSLFQFDDGRVRQTISTIADADRARLESERTLTSEKIRAAEVSLRNQELGAKILENAFRRARAESVQIKGNLIQGARTAARDLGDAKLSRSELIINSRFQSPAAIAKEARRVFDEAIAIANKRAAEGNPIRIPIKTVQDALELIKEERQLKVLDETIKAITKSLDLFLAKLAKLFGINPGDLGITPDVEEPKVRYEALGSIVDEFGEKVLVIQDNVNNQIIRIPVDKGTDLDDYVAKLNSTAEAIENLTNQPEGGVPIGLPDVDTTGLDQAKDKLDSLIDSRKLLSAPVAVDLDTEAAKSKIEELVTAYSAGADQLEEKFKEAFGNAADSFEQKLQNLEKIDIKVNFNFNGFPLPIPGLATGGPAIGGKSYMVNELGKEGFLSKGGRLSEINRPAFGKWTAPSSGTVIPAHIWKDIKSNRNFSTPNTSIGGNVPVKASLRSSGSGYDRRLTGAIIQALADRKESAAIHELSTVQAHQANEIGKLTRAVTDLTRKKWNVNVGVKAPNTSGYLQSLTSRL